MIWFDSAWLGLSLFYSVSWDFIWMTSFDYTVLIILNIIYLDTNLFNLKWLIDLIWFFFDVHLYNCDT